MAEEVTQNYPDLLAIFQEAAGRGEKIDYNSLIYKKKKLVAGVGFEPTTFGL